MFRVIAFLILSSTALSQVNDDFTRCDRPETYEEAYTTSLRDRRPLLVMLSAEWCAPCKAFKRDVLEPMVNDDEFSECVFVVVDVDKDPANAALIQSNLGTKTVPQFAGYVHDGKQWHRHLLTKERIRENVREIVTKLKKATVR